MLLLTLVIVIRQKNGKSLFVKMAIKPTSSLILVAALCVICANADDAILTLSSSSTSFPSQIMFTSDSNNATLKVAEDSSFLLQKGSNNIFSYNSTTDVLKSDYDLNLGSSLGLSAGSNNLQFQGVNQWKLWVDDDFEDNDSRTGWSQTAIATCGNSPNTFLGTSYLLI